MRALFLLISSLCVLQFLSCNQYDTLQTTLPGSISGFVKLDDEDGNTPLNNGGVTVSIDGTQLKALSDSTGRWKLENVPAGVYDIAFSREQYGTNKIISYSFAGNGNAYIPLMRVPAIPEMTSFISTARLDTTSEIVSVAVEGAVSKIVSQSTNRTVVFFFGNTEAVSSDPNSYLASSLAFVPSGGNRFSQIFSSNQLHDMGFKSGQKIYLTSFAASKMYYRYIDVNTARYYYCGISNKKQNYVQIIVP